LTIEAALRAALVEAGRGLVTFPRDLAGFPGTAHGGAVAALLYRTTTPIPPVRLRLELLRGVPTESPLRLATGSEGATARLTLSQEDRQLAAATLSRDAIAAPDPGPTVDAWRADQTPEGEVPVTATCLACGPANPLGARIRFRFNARFLWREYVPHDVYRAPDGGLHPALATIVLDELGWWLGALTQGECGVTTEVVVTVLRPLPFAPVLVMGDRAAVHTDDDPRGRYHRAAGFLLTREGVLLASVEVRFAGSRAYTRRLLQPFLETTPPETLFRLFPEARRLRERDS